MSVVFVASSFESGNSLAQEMDSS